MSDTPNQNYNEQVVIPVLQRKCQELFHANMVLETNLHVEISKSRQLAEELARSKAMVDSLANADSNDIRILQEALAQANARISQLDRDLVAARETIARMSAAPAPAPAADKVATSKVKAVGKAKIPVLEPRDDF